MHKKAGLKGKIKSPSYTVSLSGERIMYVHAGSFEGYTGHSRRILRWFEEDEIKASKDVVPYVLEAIERMK